MRRISFEGRSLPSLTEETPIAALVSIVTPVFNGMPWLPEAGMSVARQRHQVEAYRRVGGLDRRYNLAMDVDLWFRLARIGRVALLPGETLARFRLHPAAKSVADLTGAIREDRWILPSLRRLKRSVLGQRGRAA